MQAERFFSCLFFVLMNKLFVRNYCGIVSDEASITDYLSKKVMTVFDDAKMYSLNRTKKKVDTSIVHLQMEKILLLRVNMVLQYHYIICETV